MIEVKIYLEVGLSSALAGLLASAANAGVATGPAPTKAPAPPLATTNALSASAGTVASGANTTSVTGEVAVGTPENALTSGSVTSGASPSEVDSAGTPWDPERHASTKTTTKDGLWRMKVGVARPATEGLAPAGAGTPTPPPPPPVVAADPDDEFAQFRTATVAAEPAAPAARSWSDADLSKLCNQGAVKDGNPDRVKAIILKYVPEGEVPHSRNILPANREAFANEVEATLGIQYAG